MTTLVAAWAALSADRHRSELYRLWRSAASAGLTVSTAMEMMGPRESPDTEAARQWLLDGTRKGKSVGELARAAGSRFSDFERAILLLGDESGALEPSLRLLADYHAARHRAVQRATKRLAYPLFTAMCATVIAPVPLVVTGHAALYVVVVVAGIAWWMFAGGSAVQIAARRFGREPALVRARFARALATAIEAGLPVPRAIRLAADASDSDDVRRFVRGVAERALTERTLVETLSGCPHLTAEFLAVLGTAERTGDYRTTMTRLAALYEDGFR